MYSIIHFHLQASHIGKLSEYQKNAISQPLEIVLPSSGISSRETRVVFYGKFHVGLRVTPSSRSRSIVRPSAPFGIESSSSLPLSLGTKFAHTFLGERSFCETDQYIF